MAAYADYTYYSDTYLGTAISEANFPRLALRASAVIDQLCLGRAAAVMESTDTADAENQEKIQLATCAVAEEIQTQETNGNVDGMTSERVGNYSVSFAQNSNSSLTNEAKQEKCARLYLENTGLMFRGFMDGE